MIEIKIDMGQALDTLEMMEDLMSDRITKALKKTAHKVMSEARRNVREKSTDRGILARSGHVEQVDPYTFQVIFDAPYAAFVEFGTQPHYPPFEPIFAWVIRNLRVRSEYGGFEEKQIYAFKVKKDPEGKIKWKKVGGYKSKKGAYEAVKPYEKEVRKVTWAIINKIGKEGQDPKPFLRPALDMAKIWFFEYMGEYKKREKLKGGSVGPSET